MVTEQISMSSETAHVSVRRLLLGADLVLALVGLCFVLPKSFVPTTPDHYWSPEILHTAWYLSALFVLIATLAAAAWTDHRFARIGLVVVVALFAGKALNDFRLQMQLATSTELDVPSIISTGRFWIDAAFGLLPLAWLVLHLRYFIWPPRSRGLPNKSE